MDQHTFTILRADAAPSLTAIMNQPTGRFVTVKDNDGADVLVEELHGGYVNVGQIGYWVAVMASGTDAGFAEMVTLGGDGIVELVRLNADWPEIDEAPSEDALDAVNAWLVANGYAAIDAATNQAMVEAVFGLFLDGFVVGSVYVN